MQLTRLTFFPFSSSEKRTKKATAEGNNNFWPNILDMSSRWRLKRDVVSHVHSCDTSPMTTTRIHFGFLVLFKYCKSGKVLKNKSTNLNEKQKKLLDYIMGGCRWRNGRFGERNRLFVLCENTLHKTFFFLSKCLVIRSMQMEISLNSSIHCWKNVISFIFWWLLVFGTGLEKSLKIWKLWDILEKFLNYSTEVLEYFWKLLECK